MSLNPNTNSQRVSSGPGIKPYLKRPVTVFLQTISSAADNQGPDENAECIHLQYGLGLPHMHVWHFVRFLVSLFQ